MAPLPEVLSRLGAEPRFHSLLAELCGGEAEYLVDVLAADLEGRSDGEGRIVTGPVARGLVRKLQALRGGAAGAGSGGHAPPSTPELPAVGEAAVAALPPRALPALPADPRDVKALRRAVAALDRPDEGMRGTPADALKLQAAADPAIVAALAGALQGRMAEAATAAATIRSIAITPVAAVGVCEAGVPAALAQTLQRPALTGNPVLAWSLPAVARLAQHRETHGRLLAVGFARLLEQRAHGRVAARTSPLPDAVPPPRLDLVAAIALAFLSQTGGPDLASRVPLRIMPELVSMLQRRFFMPEPAEVVSSRAFCGLPLYYRPRFLVQAIHCLAQHSGAHAATAWRTSLPELLTALLEDTLPSDAAENRPYGSPDAAELAKPCAEALLAAEGGSPEARSALLAAVRGPGGRAPGPRAGASRL